MLENAGARLMHSWMTSAAAKGPRASGWQTINSGMERSSGPDPGAPPDAGGGSSRGDAGEPPTSELPGTGSPAVDRRSGSWRPGRVTDALDDDLLAPGAGVT
jgi:hypothetical protein